MPDVHLAEDVCIGTVLATHQTLYPAAIGGDIGCGVAAIRFDGPASAIADKTDAALDLLRRLVPIQAHPRSQPVDLPPLSTPGLRSLQRRTATRQLGTLGRGNHFLEMQRDAEEHLWVMVHSGSRAMGPAIQQEHRPPRRLGGIDAESPEGVAYLHDHDVALQYARANRRAILAAAGAVVMKLTGSEPEVDTFLDCTHNLVRSERHGVQTLWVHRKGAIPAGEGELGIIPGSMGAPTCLVTGRGCSEALGSSSHGAGRAMSRTEARRRITTRRLREQMRGVAWDRAAARDLREEAPAAYKDIGRVMRAQRELTQIRSELQPVLSYKGR